MFLFLLICKTLQLEIVKSVITKLWENNDAFKARIQTLESEIEVLRNEKQEVLSASQQ